MDNYNKTIVIINGSGGCGKDTFVSMCKTVNSKERKSVLNLSVIDRVKEIAKQAGWNGGKSEKDRKFLADLKSLVDNYNSLSRNYICDSIKYAFDYEDSNPCSDKSHLIIFVHAREPEDIDFFVNKYKQEGITICTLLIRNKNIPRITSNHADAEVENYNYDFIIENDGTLEDLNLKAKKFMSIFLN